MPNKSKVKRKTPKTDHGHKLKVKPHPPEFTSRPWFPLVVRCENLGTSFSANGLALNLLSQLDLPSVTPIFLRLQSVKIWGALVPFGSGPLKPLTVGFLDFIAENTSSGANTVVAENRILEQYTSYPDLVNRASLGYHYSAAHSNLVLNNNNSYDTPLMALDGVGDGSVAYYYVLWRTGRVTPTLNQLSNKSESGWFHLSK